MLTRPPGDIVLRRASAGDADRLYELLNHPDVNANLAFDRCSRREFEAILAELISGGELLIAEDNGEVAAVCRIARGRHRLRHVAQLGTLAVTPEKQSRGLGRRFVAEILSRLRAEGFHRIELSVAADNGKAIRFFESLGFETEGTLRDYFTREGFDGYFDERVMARVGK